MDVAHRQSDTIAHDLQPKAVSQGTGEGVISNPDTLRLPQFEMCGVAC